MSQNYNEIHKVIKDRYGALARTVRDADPDFIVMATTGCCGDDIAADCGCGPTLYDAGMLDGLPVDVTGLSLGCGDPVTIASLKKGETVLDLGSGGGIDCFLAARQVGPTGYVIGVDMTPDMLTRANENKASLGMENVEFRQGQIEALPVDDNTIDVIMSNCVINLSPDKAAVFGEAFRVLRQGGRIAVSDIVTEGTFSDELRQMVDKWAECVTGAIELDAYTNLMREAGFVDIQVVDKVNAAEIVSVEHGLPRIFSARITARKP